MEKEELVKIRNFFEKYPDLRFCKLLNINDETKDLGLRKSPGYKDWQNKIYKLDEIQDGQFGVLGGFGNLTIIDIDKRYIEALKIISDLNIDETFQVESGTSTSEITKKHFYYIIEGDFPTTNTTIDFGDVKCKGGYVVGPGCKTINYYKANYFPIRKITTETYKILLNRLKSKKDYEIKSDLQVEGCSIESFICKHDDRLEFLLEDEKLQQHIAKLKTGMKNNYLFNNIAAFVKYRPGMLEKALKFCKICNYSEAEFYGWLNRDGLSVSKSQLDEFFKVTEIDKIYKKYKLQPYTLRNLFSENTNPPEFLILNYLEKGILCSLIGQSGGGKTFITYYEACCLATGSRCFGHPVRKCNVLLLDNEANEKRKKERFEGILKGMGLKWLDTEDRIHLKYYTNLEKENLLELIEYIKEHNIEYIVVDNLRSHYGVDENDSTQIGTALKPLKDIVHTLGVTIKFLHHTNKMGNYSGATAIMSHTDESLVLDFKQGDAEKKNDNIIYIKYKDGKERYSNYFRSFNVKLEIYNRYENYMFAGEEVESPPICDLVKIEKLDEKEINDNIRYVFKNWVFKRMKGNKLTLNQIATGYTEEIGSARKIPTNTFRYWLDELEKENVVMMLKQGVGKTTYYTLNDNYKVKIE